MLSQLPVSLTEEEMDEILRAGDSNEDGVFDLSELGWVARGRVQINTSEYSKGY